MAHDKQFKDTIEGVRILGFRHPMKNEWYWNRSTHKVEQADNDMQEKFLIVEEPDETLS